MLTPNAPDAVLVTPSDIYRRASVADFVRLVNSQVPRLTWTVDHAIMAAYALAYWEARSPEHGSVVRQTSAVLGGIEAEDLDGLLACAYATLFPSLAPDVSEYLA